MKAAGQTRFVPTDEQRNAIEHVYGPMLVVAGAGTGKTTVLTRRIAHLMESQAARPDEILAVTYTRNAAAELVERVGGLLYPGDAEARERLEQSGLQATTFHSYCRELLCQAGIRLELIDDKDLFVLLRQRQEELKLKYYITPANLGKFLHDLTAFFKRCHDELRTPDHYDAYVARLERGDTAVPRVTKSKDAQVMSDAEALDRCHEIARVYRFTEDLLRREGIGTFEHLITRAVALLSQNSAALERARRRAKFLLIDEFQDSNVAQIHLAKLLGGEEPNIFAVGDPDQAVYRFRGASSGTFDQFLRTFGSEKVKRVTMVKNRRSTPPILRSAYAAIAKNPQITSVVLQDGPWERKALECGRLEANATLAQATPVQLILHNSHEQEASFIADTIEEARKANPRAMLADFAVLYRGHKCREQMVTELRRRRVPFRVKGVDLFDTPQVRDALAALRLMAGPDAISLFRFAALPQFEIDPVIFRAALAAAPHGTAMEKVLEKVRGGLAVVECVREIRHDLDNAKRSLEAAMKLLSTRMGLRASLPGRRLAELADTWLKKPKAIRGDGTLAEFLGYLELYCEAGGVLPEDKADLDPLGPLWPNGKGEEGDRDAVQLMSVHGAKGLEFPTVFVLRIDSGSFPGHYRETLVEFPDELRDKDTEGQGDPRALHAEEERRLFYVAMTRAKDWLYLCGKREMKGKNPVPAKYLQELDAAADNGLKAALSVSFLDRPEVSMAGVQPESIAGPAENLRRWLQLPPRAGTKLGELSATAIQQYEQCPLAFKLDRDWNIPSEPVASTQFGGAMHLALKAYFDGVAAGRPPLEAEVIQCFLDAFRKAKIEEELQRRLHEVEGREQLTALLQSELAQPMGSIVANEKRFRLDVGGTTIVGRMDRVDRVQGDRVVIVDYKTGTPMEGKDAKANLQLSVYALAARRMGMQPSQLVLINLKNTTLVTTNRNAEDDAKTETKIADIANRIACGEFGPKKNFFCDRCAYFSICPAQEMVFDAGTKE